MLFASAGYKSSKKIDAEQFQTAKTTLKSIIKMILLMESSLLSFRYVYLAQNVADSAAIAYKAGFRC
jgi:hypothetical protein